MTKSLAGKKVLITGASAGIGRETALLLAKAGASVIATGRRQDRLDKLAQHASADGRIDTIAGDLTDNSFIDRLSGHVGVPDILVNNAGQLQHAPFLESTQDEWRKIFDSNVFALLQLTQVIGRKMVTAGRGHIVNVSSVLAREVTPFTLVYAASKYAVRAITEGLRLELGPHGVKITEVAPGLVTTEINRGITHPYVRDYYAARADAFRYLDPADIAEAILYAVSAADHALPEFIDVRPARQSRGIFVPKSAEGQ